MLAARRTDEMAKCETYISPEARVIKRIQRNTSKDRLWAEREARQYFLSAACLLQQGSARVQFVSISPRLYRDISKPVD